MGERDTLPVLYQRAVRERVRLRDELAAERAHADRLAEALRDVLPFARVFGPEGCPPAVAGDFALAEHDKRRAEA